jgi:hypothetical protein
MIIDIMGPVIEHGRRDTPLCLLKIAVGGGRRIIMTAPGSLLRRPCIQPIHRLDSMFEERD